jgi:hypothetical protein
MTRLRRKRKTIVKPAPSWDWIEDEGLEPKKKKLDKNEAHCYGWIEA